MIKCFLKNPSICAAISFSFFSLIFSPISEGVPFIPQAQLLRPSYHQANDIHLLDNNTPSINTAAKRQQLRFRLTNSNEQTWHDNHLGHYFTRPWHGFLIWAYMHTLFVLIPSFPHLYNIHAKGVAYS